MKISKKTAIKAIIIAICTAFSVQIMPMSRASQMLTPEQKRALIAKRAVFNKAKATAAASAVQNPIWIRTNDNNVIAIAQWKINEMTELSSLVKDQDGKNSQTNPTNVSMLTRSDLELLSTALDKISSGQFDQYYESLKPEYVKSLTDKNVGPGQLRNLITLAGTIKATTLSAFLASYFLPNDMQKYLMVPQIVSPVADYLKSEIVKKNRLHQAPLIGHEGKLVNVEFSKDSTVAVTSAEGEHNNIITWNIPAGQQLQTFTISEGEIDGVQINNDGSRIAAIVSKNFEMQELFNKNEQPTTETKEILILWDAKTGRQIKIFDNLPDTTIFFIEFSSDGKRIVIPVGHEVTVTNPEQEEKGYIIIADSETGNIIATHEVANNYPDVQPNPNGNTLLARSESDLILYDINTGQKIKKLDGPTEIIYDANYSGDGTKIIARDFTAQTIFIWNGNTGEQITQFNNIVPNAFAINHDGTKMATVSLSETTDTISIWDVATKTVTHTIDSKQTEVTSTQFSPDSRMIISTGLGDKNIILWDALTGKQLHALNHSNNLPDVNFSSDGKRIKSHSSPAIGEEKCTTMLWNTDTGKKIHTFIAEHDLLEEDSNFINIISPDDTNNRNFILWTSLSKDERNTLEKIENNLNIDQAHLLYQLYMAKISNTLISLSDKQQLASLPADILSIVNTYLKPTPLPKATLALKPQPFEQPAMVTTLSKTAPVKSQPLKQPAKPIQEPEIRKSQTWADWARSWWK